MLFIINYCKNSDCKLIVHVKFPEYEQPSSFSPDKIVINKEKIYHVLFTIKEIIYVTLDYYNKL